MFLLISTMDYTKISKYIHVQRSKSWTSSPKKCLLRCFDNINGNKCDHFPHKSLPSIFIKFDFCASFEFPGKPFNNWNLSSFFLRCEHLQNATQHSVGRYERDEVPSASGCCKMMKMVVATNISRVRRRWAAGITSLIACKPPCK